MARAAPTKWFALLFPSVLLNHGGWTPARGGHAGGVCPVVCAACILSLGMMQMEACVPEG